MVKPAKKIEKVKVLEGDKKTIKKVEAKVTTKKIKTKVTSKKVEAKIANK